MSNEKKIDVKVIPTNGESNTRAKHPSYIAPGDGSRVVFSSISTVDKPILTRPPETSKEPEKKDK